MISNAQVALFIRLTQHAGEGLPADLNEDAVRNVFQIERGEGGVASAQLKEALWSTIKVTVGNGNPKSGVNFRALRSALYRRSRFLGDESAHSCFLVCEAILFGVSETYFTSLEAASAWTKAIQAALAISRLDDVERTFRHERDNIVCDAANRWRSRGYGIRLEGGQFLFDESEYVRAATEIEDMVRRIGGRRLVNVLLVSLQNSEQFADDRYSIPSSATTLPTERAVGSLPYGYLLQLAVKHFRSEPSYASRETAARCLEYATDLVSVLDVEHFSAFSKVFTDIEHLPQYVRTAALDEFCFRFRQIRPVDALYMLEELFGWMQFEPLRKHRGWGYAEVISIARLCLKETDARAVNQVYDLATISDRTGLPLSTTKALMSWFTHRTDEVNVDFVSPTDAIQCDFFLKPFVWKSGHKVLMPAPPVAGVAFIEAFLGILREAVGPEADSRVGYAMEAVLASSFRRQGIEPTAVSQKYRVGKQQFDCDLLVETPDAILLFEVKKKSLTHATLAGGPLEGLTDLSLAMVKAQTQLLHHEYALSQDKGIRFENGIHVVRGGRRIEKIAVTLFDWGAIQDRVVSDTLLNQLGSGVQIQADQVPESQKKRLEECNRILERVRAQRVKAAQLTETSQPFFDCTFLGLPHILFMLAGVKTSEEFIENLRAFKQIIAQTLDPYRGLRYAQYLRGYKTDLATCQSVEEDSLQRLI